MGDHAALAMGPSACAKTAIAFQGGNVAFEMTLNAFEMKEVAFETTLNSFEIKKVAFEGTQVAFESTKDTVLFALGEGSAAWVTR